MKPRRSSNNPRRTVLFSTTALLIIAVAVATVWTSYNRHERGLGSPATEPLGHVHGLGVDPADGMLYSATHYGLFRLPEGGKPERVSDLRQDTMSFTVVGPGHFLGSGHPDPRTGEARANLGLIESTDTGRTWHPLSLSGQVDFHSLEAKHGKVVGHSRTAGALLSSEDRTSWERLATAPLADFTVSPASPEELVATTEQGPIRSTDGGRNFTSTPNTPLLYLLDWSKPDQLHGLDPRGRAFMSPDGGTTWEARGQLGSTPQAMTVDRDRWYVATANAVLVSSDGGRTFTTRTPFT